MATSLQRHCGIAPRRPGRLLAIAGSLLLAGLTLTLMIGLLLAGEFGRHSPREHYYLWLWGLAVAGFAAAPWPRLSAALLAIGFIDLGLGATSLSLQQLGWPVASIMPPPYHPGGGYRWHPLLQAVPIPDLRGGVPGLAINHSSAGTRGREWTPAELAQRKVIAVFGGSTTYDIAVGDGETWPDRLEQRLPGTAVINHGVPGYSTVENLVQTAFYEEAFGRRPDCAVYYVGWNDIRSAGLTYLDAGYARHHLRSQIDSLRVRRIAGDFTTFSPIATLMVRGAALLLDTARPPPAIEGVVVEEPDPRLERIFLRNVGVISAINRSRGIRTLWVGQLLNVQALADQETGDWTPLIRGKDLWRLQSRLNDLLRAEAQRLGDAYVDVPIEAFGDGDFADSGHFSPSGSSRFADHLAPAVREHCL